MTNIEASAGATVNPEWRYADQNAGPTGPTNELGKDEFLQLLVAQLKHQDPLNPSSSDEFIATTAQFTVVEKLDELTKQTENSALVSSLSTAGSLVGREVSANLDGELFDTTVTRSSIVSGKVVLDTANGQQIRLDQVASVGPLARTASPESAAAPTASSSGVGEPATSPDEAVSPLPEQAIAPLPDEVVSPTIAPLPEKASAPLPEQTAPSTAPPAELGLDDTVRPAVLDFIDSVEPDKSTATEPIPPQILARLTSALQAASSEAPDRAETVQSVIEYILTGEQPAAQSNTTPRPQAEAQVESEDPVVSAGSVVSERSVVSEDAAPVLSDSGLVLQPPDPADAPVIVTPT